MSGLTEQEQANVRVALRHLRWRCGNIATLAKALRVSYQTIKEATRGARVTERVAFGAARLAKVSIDDVLSGAYPPAGTCPHCGRPSS